MTTPARDALTEWTRTTLTDEQRATASRLIAAYVAESVRADRAKGARRIGQADASEGRFDDAFSRFDAVFSRFDAMFSRLATLGKR